MTTKKHKVKLSYFFGRLYSPQELDKLKDSLNSIPEKNRFRREVNGTLLVDTYLLANDTPEEEIAQELDHYELHGDLLVMTHSLRTIEITKIRSIPRKILTQSDLSTVVRVPIYQTRSGQGETSVDRTWWTVRAAYDHLTPASVPLDYGIETIWKEGNFRKKLLIQPFHNRGY